MLTTPYNVPVSNFIEKLAKYIRENVDEVDPPTWASIVKTGRHAEKQPQNPNWWYIRCASILRKIYVHGPIGIERLRAEYGGRKEFGVKPAHATKSGGAIIRKALRQLEIAGLIEISESLGRRITIKGRKLLKEIAEEIQKEIVKENPELMKYKEGE